MCQRILKSVVIQSENPIPVLRNSFTQTNIPDYNAVFVEYITFLIDAEMNQSTLPVMQLSSNKVPQNFLFDSRASIYLIIQLFFQQVIHHVHYNRISSKVKLTTVNLTVAYSGCINVSFKIRNNF